MSDWLLIAIYLLGIAQGAGFVWIVMRRRQTKYVTIAELKEVMCRPENIRAAAAKAMAAVNQARARGEFLS